MKISYNWLTSYIKIDLPVEDISDILTNTGLEVEEIHDYESVSGGLKGLVIGEVKTVRKHPNADKLLITETDIGGEELLQIVCGAPNVAEGQKVIVAPVGSTIYPINGDPFKIRKVKIRGESSYGMICAEDEIGLGTDHDGIMVLDEKAEVGKAAGEFFSIERDTIFEIGLTPNRSDAMSHIGVARDVAAAMNALFKTNKELCLPDTSSFKIDNNSLQIEVKVEDIEACPRYSGVTISNLQVKPSPDWLVKRLSSIGVRPINNVVDVTNFVLHEYGQPLHAFDAGKIEGNQIIVKKLPEGNTFLTLDETERKLSSEDLMICNKNAGMCIAGIFGGIKSGVSESTTAIFLESAYFDPSTIRKTSTRHNLRTDAATHYEKGTDPGMTVEILKRTAMLIKEVAGGEISSEITDIYPNPKENHTVKLSIDRLKKVCGVNIAADKVKSILSDLDIEVINESGSVWSLSIPTYRTDVLREQDVMEEILRIYGYNQVPIPLKLNSVINSGGNESYKKETSISALLRGLGFCELFANSISKSAFYDDSELTDAVILQNSMTAELDMMRNNMLYGGLEVMAYNMNRQNSDIKLFEFGKTYHRYSRKYEEKKHLVLFVSGKIQSESWTTEEHPADFYFLKGIVEAILGKIGIDKWKVNDITEDPHITEGIIFNIKEGQIAKFGLLENKILNRSGVKQKVYFADLNWDLMLQKQAHHQVRYKQTPKFPFVRRDLALLVDEKVQFSDIKKLTNIDKQDILREVNLFDVYTGKNLEKGKKSYAISYVFQDSDKTLTDEEVDQCMNSLISQYAQKLNAEIR